MPDDKLTVPVCWYDEKTGEPSYVMAEPGAKAPAGFVDSPAKVKKAAKA